MNSSLNKRRAEDDHNDEDNLELPFKIAKREKVCGMCKDTRRVPYKCPQCYMDYCSVNCWNAHKANAGMCVPVKRLRKGEAKDGGKLGGSTSAVKLHDYRFPSEYTVPPEKLKRLTEGKALGRLKKLVAKPHMQDLVRKLNSCENPKEEISKCLQNPDFLKCAHFMLKFMMEDDIPNFSGSSGSEDES